MEARRGPGLILEVTDTPTPPSTPPPGGSDVYRSVRPDRRQPIPGHSSQLGFLLASPWAQGLMCGGCAEGPAW